MSAGRVSSIVSKGFRELVVGKGVFLHVYESRRRREKVYCNIKLKAAARLSSVPDEAQVLKKKADIKAAEHNALFEDAKVGGRRV